MASLNFRRFLSVGGGSPLFSFKVHYVLQDGSVDFLPTGVGKKF